MPSKLGNTEDHYGAIAIVFHWSMALIVIGLAALGLYMVTLPDVGFNTKKIMLILYHKEFGLLVLVLLVTRLAWRVTQHTAAIGCTPTGLATNRRSVCPSFLLCADVRFADDWLAHVFRRRDPGIVLWPFHAT